MITSSTFKITLSSSFFSFTNARTNSSLLSSNSTVILAFPLLAVPRKISEYDGVSAGMLTKIILADNDGQL